MATTTNFGWETPDDTDLVKDGALAMRTLGNAIDASLVDLKGGTTGQVLSKNSNTDMDFTWVTSDDANAIQNAIVDAKGDLITATAADTPARIAVGNNGETLVADSSTSTGLRYQPVNNGNYAPNGGFDIWQRGTSFAQTAGELFTADRWFSFRDGFATGATISRQNSGVNFTRYCARVQRDSGNTGTGKIHLSTTLETSDSIGFAGQTVTFSFYARAGANYSGGALTGNVNYGTGTDQRVTAFTGNTTAFSVNATLTTSWQRFQATGTINANATEIGFLLFYTPSGTAGANDYFEVTGVQFEVGSIATTFKRAGGTLAGELVACGRYYQRFGNNPNIGTNGYNRLTGFSPASSSTRVYVLSNLWTPLRTSPTSIEYSGIKIYDGTTFYTITSLAFDQIGAYQTSLTADVASGLTQYRPYCLIQENSGAHYLAFNAEL